MHLANDVEEYDLDRQVKPVNTQVPNWNLIVQF